MEIILKEDGVMIESVKDFNVAQIFNCGQAFRFKQIDENVFEGIAFGKYLRVEYTDDTLRLSPCSLYEYENIWSRFFDLSTDYSVLKRSISDMSPVLKSATEFGGGIRILKQDPWEIIISFIISANNNIPRIQGAIEKLSKKYGHLIMTPDGREYYSFPTPEKLAQASLEDLRACGVGYRDKYIKRSAEMFVQGAIDINEIKQMNRADAEKELLKLMGVGKKVADCILLFGFSHMDAFPVDTWVKKVITKYFLDEKASTNEIQNFVDTTFGDIAGYVQQYLFYYIRELD